MADYFDSLGNVVVDRSPDELVAAVVIALALALAFAGISFIGRGKLRDALMPMIAFMIIANLASMAVGAGYLLHSQRKWGYLKSEKTDGATQRPGPLLVATIFRAADKNRDGLLSGEEASAAAAEFVRRADPNGKGEINARSLEQALPAGRSHGRSPVGHSFPPYHGPSPPAMPPFHPHRDRPGHVPPPPPGGPPPADQDAEALPSSAAGPPSNGPGHEPGHVIE